MSDPYIGEVRLFGGNFAPRGWAFCNGQLLPTASNVALFSVIGDRFGGDGVDTFALPDLRGRIPVGAGAGPGLTAREVGEALGEDAVTLTEAQLPAHTHGAPLAAQGDRVDPLGAAVGVAAEATYGEGDAQQSLASEAVTSAGGGGPHENRQPFLAVHFIIAIQGVFPARD